MSKIYTFPNKTIGNVGWKEKLAATGCYLLLAYFCQMPGQFPFTVFLFYGLGYWVIVQPRRHNFTLFFRLQALQAVFAFILVSGAFQLVLLAANFLSAMLGLFNISEGMLGLQYVYGMPFVLLARYSCLALAIVGSAFCLRGQSQKLPVAGEWAASLA